MGKERRKFPRSQCILPAEIIKSEGKRNLIERVSARDFSREGLKLIINFNLNPSFILESKLYIPEKKLFTWLSGEIIWNKYVDNKLEVGLKIKMMDEEPKGEILDWVFPRWLEIERRKKQ